MAHGTRNRANLAAWSTGTVVLDTEFDSFDDVVFDALRESGGTYSLGATLTLGSANPSTSFLTVTAPMRIGGTSTALTVLSGATSTWASGSTLAMSAGAAGTVACTITLSGSALIDCGGSSIIQMGSGTTFKALVGSGVDLRGSVLVKSTATVAFTAGAIVSGTYTSIAAMTCDGGSEEFKNGATVDFDNSAHATFKSGSLFEIQSGCLTTIAECNLTSTATFGATITRTGKETLSGASARTVKRLTTANDADQTVDVSKDVWQIPATLTGSRTYTLRHSTSPVPSAGEELHFFRTAPTGTSANAAYIKREDGTTLFIFANSYHGFCKVVFDGSAWQILEWKQDLGSALTNTGLYGN